MSSMWKKPWYSPRQQEQNWLNGIWQTHDNFCSCGETWLHLLYCINKDSPFKKPLTDIKNIQCLLIGKEDVPTTSKEDDDPGFLPGELDALFDEGSTKRDTENADTR